MPVSSKGMARRRKVRGPLIAMSVTSWISPVLFLVRLCQHSSRIEPKILVGGWEAKEENLLPKTGRVAGTQVRCLCVLKRSILPESENGQPSLCCCLLDFQDDDESARRYKFPPAVFASPCAVKLSSRNQQKETTKDGTTGEKSPNHGDESTVCSRPGEIKLRRLYVIDT